jgi:hypothetical protein
MDQTCWSNLFWALFLNQSCDVVYCGYSLGSTVGFWVVRNENLNCASASLFGYGPSGLNKANFIAVFRGHHLWPNTTRVTIRNVTSRQPSEFALHTRRRQHADFKNLCESSLLLHQTSQIPRLLKMARCFILVASGHIACYCSPQAQVPHLDATRNASCPTAPAFEPRGAAPQVFQARPFPPSSLNHFGILPIISGVYR